MFYVVIFSIYSYSQPARTNSRPTEDAQMYSTDYETEKFASADYVEPTVSKKSARLQLARSDQTEGGSGGAARDFDHGVDEHYNNIGLYAYGQPVDEFPTFHTVPRNTFNCREQQWPGYYADMSTRCQVSFKLF